MAKSGLVVDFEGVESGGGRVRVPEGDYKIKLVDVKVGTAKSSGKTMLIWEFEIAEGKYKGKKFKDYTTLNVEARWKLKKVLEAFGIDVPQSKLDLAPLLKKLKGKVTGATITDEEYEGKMSSKITDYLDPDALNEDDDDEGDEDEEPKAKKKKGKKKKKKEDDDDEIEDLDTDEL